MTLGSITTTFEIDGNVVPNGGIDWNNIGTAHPYTTVDGFPSTGVVDATTGSDPCFPATDTTRLSGKLDGDWEVVGGSPNDKSDLCTAASAVEMVDVNGQNHYLLYLNWTRSYDGKGDLVVYQHLEGGEPGRNGDYLIAFDYHSAGGGSVVIYALSWNGSTWIEVSLPGKAASGLNPNPPANQTSNIGTFGESAFDLTAGGLFADEGCQTYTTGAVITQTGNSTEATMQDKVASDPISISNCGSLKVTKEAVGAPSDLDFTYTIDQTDTKPVANVDQLMVDPSGTSKVLTGNPTVTRITAKIGAGDTQTWSHLLAQPDYQVKELTGDLPDGVSLDNVTCVAYDPFEGRMTTTVLYENGEATGKIFPIVPESLSPTVAHCTITNVVTSLTLNKVLPNNSGGTATGEDFLLSAAGPTPLEGLDPDTTSLKVGVSDIVEVGTYTLSEKTMAGYAASDWTCTVNGDPVTVTDSKVSVAKGQTVICAVTNDDIPARLTLVKQVDNVDVGKLTTADFPLTFTGSAGYTGTGVSGSDAVRNRPVPADTYTLSEGTQTGYTASAWTCVDTGTTDAVAVTDGKIKLGLADDVTCTIKNTYVPATLTLVKKVINDDGGTADKTAFTLSAKGPDTISGVTGAASVTNRLVQFGSYTLSESAVPGYENLGWACKAGDKTVTVTDDVVKLMSGDDVTCTVTNDDISANLTLVKHVVTDDGGSAVDTDFTLTATGPTTITGVTGDETITGARVEYGNYTLTESGLKGYENLGWTCVNASKPGSAPVEVDEGGSIALAFSDDITCTVTNDDIPAHLTLVKVVDNVGVGTLDVTDFPLTFTGDDGATGTGVSGSEDVTDVEVPADTYTLSEETQDGYTASAWSCVVTDTTTPVDVSEGMVDVALDTDVTCTITNTYQPATLTLVKDIVNDDGGNAAATDWTLTAAGPDTIIGATGADSVTGVLVQAGTYALSESGPAGYEASDWTCVTSSPNQDRAAGEPVDVVDGSVVLDNGDNVTCAVTNDDLPVDLALTKGDGDVEAMVDVPFDYTITVTNVGERDVDLNEAVSVTDTLPAELIAVSGPDNCDVVGQIITCDLAPSDLAVGESVTFTLSVVFAEGTPAGTYTNTATVRTPDDNNPVNDTDTEDTPLLPVTDLMATKSLVDSTPEFNSDGVSVVDFGETFGYKIMVKTTGNAPQTNVVITDVVPDGLEYVEGSAVCEGTCTVMYDDATATITWTYAALSTGTAVALNFQVTLPALPADLAPGTYGWEGTNVAEFGSDTVGVQPTNEVHTVAVETIMAPPPPPDTGSDGSDTTGTPAGVLALLGALTIAAAARKR